MSEECGVLFPGVQRDSEKFWKLFWAMMTYRRCESMRYSHWAYVHGIRTYDAYLDFGGPFP